MTDHYAGSELATFARATNWKHYLSHHIAPHVGERVLEVGAGIGSNIPYLRHRDTRRWVALEPDPALAAEIPKAYGAEECQVVVGKLASLPRSEQFDTILYIDVLEHITDDAAELAAAARHLAPAGRIVVAAPAHQYLFTPFDMNIGHHRRYSASALAAISPQGCRLIDSRMLDSVGFFASLANRLVLQSSSPSERQIAFWDKAMVPMSQIVDRLSCYRLGKTVMAVWMRED